jgi:hypothetical protein
MSAEMYSKEWIIDTSQSSFRGKRVTKREIVQVRLHRQYQTYIWSGPDVDWRVHPDTSV